MSAACYFCEQPVQPGDEVDNHHPVYKSKGGTHTEPAHKDCHVAHHSEEGDFRAWGREGGKLSSLTRRWSLNLKHVRTDPRHDLNRAFYQACYAR
jgi:hypothetical protein